MESNIFESKEGLVSNTKEKKSSESIQQFESRKRDHIEQSLDIRNEAIGLSGLEKVGLIHNSLPEIDFSEVNLKTEILGAVQKTPFLVSSMTAGHIDGQSINEALYMACAESGWIMGVGSQRRELNDKNAGREWQELRAKAEKKVQLLSNIGLAQLIEFGPEKILTLAENLQAIGLIIHLNPLQEVMQPEGTPNFKGGVRALTELVAASDIPIVVKETGSGMSRSVFEVLSRIGVDAVDVSGLGGTHWGRIEGSRAIRSGLHNVAAETFRNWGISTLESTITGAEFGGSFEVWASGGVRTGLDAAKLLALGARCVGFAKPLLQAAISGPDTVIAVMKQIEYELRVAMFCTGNKNVDEFKTAKVWAWK